MKETSVVVAILIAMAIANMAVAEHIGDYQVLNARGNAIDRGENWPDTTIGLEAGGKFMYIGLIPDFKERLEVFLAFPDGDWENVEVSIDSARCLVTKQYNTTELIDEWPDMYNYRAACPTVWYTTKIPSIKQVDAKGYCVNHTLVVKATKPCRLKIPESDTVFWILYPDYRK